MTDYPQDVLLEENRLTGAVLWAVLASHIDYDRGGIDNQPQATAFDSTAPQRVTLEWDHKRDSQLPCDWFTYEVLATIDPSVKAINDTKVTLKVNECHPNGDLLISTSYELTLRTLLKLLPQLKAKKPLRNSYLAILPCSGVDEYDLVALLEELGLPGHRA